MEFKFRNLKPDEIAVKASRVNNGGVELLLWPKSIIVTAGILDETVGAKNWRCETSIPGICKLYIGDVCREGSADAIHDSVAAQHHAAFNNAAQMWGIGASLYNSPRIFFPKSMLQAYAEGQNGPYCNDFFAVKEIIYSEDGNAVISVTITASTWKAQNHHEQIFINSAFKKQPMSVSIDNEQQPGANEGGISKFIPNDEIILLGGCKGMTFEEAFPQEKFKSFLKWARGTEKVYEDDKFQAQLLKLKNVAKEHNIA